MLVVVEVHNPELLHVVKVTMVVQVLNLQVHALVINKFVHVIHVKLLTLIIQQMQMTL